jgi:uncharacterized protein YjgD (DUF1641 family)
MDQSLVELNQKIDQLTAQVAYLAEQAQLAERQRRDREELLRDLTPVVNEAFRLSVEQLEEVEQYVDLSDLFNILKRVLRSGRNIEKMLDQLESLMDFSETVGPITDQAFSQAVDVLATMEHKGYFVFARGGMQIMDNIVTSFSEEDVQLLGENVVLILQTIKAMTQPEIMNFARNMAQAMEQQDDAEVNIGYRYLLQQMRNPDVRRGLALTMRVLSSIGKTTGDNRQPVAAARLN